MSVTTYTIGCGYELLKLKDTVFFLSKNQLKTITIDNGEAYVDFVNQSPYPPSPNRLKGFNVKLTETESLDERYKFTKQLTMSITGHLTDSTFLLDDDYYIVVQTEDGTYYLVNVDFPSKMTYTYNLSEGQNQTDFTFTSNSNHPTLKLNWNPVTWNTCQTYQVFGIDSLKLLEKDYTTIDAEQGVINLFDGNEFKDVDYLKNTISLQENYDGKIATTTITFEIPFNNYKPSWQYNLLEFTQNLYTAHITPKNSTSGIFCGYEHGLQPQYELNGSTSNGESTSIKITLTEASEWGIFKFDTWSYYRDSSKRWVGIDSEVKCIDLGVGINTLMQEVDTNGTPTQRYKCLEGYESEYTNYNIVGTYTEDEVESFRTSVCTRFKTRGGSASALYTCIDGNKYILLCNQVSYDGGKHWIDDDVYELGEMVESGSSWCEIEPQYKWKISDKWECVELFKRWIPSGETCINGNKYQNNIKQVSTDGGETWTVVIPEEYSASTLIESDSYDCGYRTGTTSGDPYCQGYDKYVDVYYRTSTDGGTTWVTASTTPTLVEAQSEDCGYVPPTPTIDGKFKLTLNDSSTVSAECDSTSSVTSGEVATQYSGSVTPALVKAEIGDCVKTIGGSAFYKCSGLTSVTISDNVKSISGFAFDSCTSLVTCNMGTGVTSIGNGAFYNCSSLTSITIPNGVTSIKSWTFYQCYSLTSITIPNGVTSIGQAAFLQCTGLTGSLLIPDSVTSIGDSAFSGCKSLKSYTIGSGVTSISRYAFDNCTSLTSITINATTPPALGESTFSVTNNCPIYVPCASVDTYKAASGWSNYASRIQGIPPCGQPTPSGNKFTLTLSNSSTVTAECDSTSELTRREISGYSSNTITAVVGNCVRRLGDESFNSYVNLRSIDIPNSVTSIGSWVFHQCVNLRTITIPNTVTSIGGGAFYHCCSLSSINIPSGVTTIEDHTFSNCSGLTSIDIPNGVTSIGQWAFHDCNHITSCTIGNNVTYIGEAAFFNCKFTNLTLPSSLETIFSYGFASCTNLSSIVIPDSVATIGATSFGDCTSLTSATIGNGVTSIGGGAFQGCSNLTNLTILAPTPPTLGDRVFYRSNNLAAIYVPAASVDSYKAASGWSTYANIIQAIP